jgi:hypothetical protein
LGAIFQGMDFLSKSKGKSAPPSSPYLLREKEKKVGIVRRPYLLLPELCVYGPGALGFHVPFAAHPMALYFSLSLLVLSSGQTNLPSPSCSAPPGFYCSGSSVLLCPSGSYCPLSSTKPTQCPDGTTSGTGASYSSACKSRCGAGSFPVNFTLPQATPYFQYSGAYQFISVPRSFACPNISAAVYLWGAGGGPNPFGNKIGGAGAFVGGKLLLAEGGSLRVIVGRGGFTKIGAHTYPGIPNPGYDFQGSGGQGGIGGGGGRSAIQILVNGSFVEVVTAGGGGGAGGYPTDPSSHTNGGAATWSGTAWSGGNFARSSAYAHACNVVGGGGSQTSSATGYVSCYGEATMSGGLFQGGNDTEWTVGACGGGGGGGFYGGGAGQCRSGGGGSSLTANLIGAFGADGIGTNAPNTGSPFYISGVARAGGHGLVVLDMSSAFNSCKDLYVCNACPRGSYCPLNSTNATLCPAGTYNPSTGASSVTACLICPVGSYCPLNSINATLCPEGTYNPTTGASSFSGCLICTPGAYCPTKGLTSPVKCPVGYFCPLSSTNTIPCPPNVSCITAGLSSLPTSLPLLPGQPCTSNATCSTGSCLFGACCSPNAVRAGCTGCALQTGACLTHSPGDPCTSPFDCASSQCLGGCCCTPQALLTPGCTACACFSNASTTVTTAGRCTASNSSSFSPIAPGGGQCTPSSKTPTPDTLSRLIAFPPIMNVTEPQPILVLSSLSPLNSHRALKLFQCFYSYHMEALSLYFCCSSHFYSPYISKSFDPLVCDSLNLTPPPLPPFF